VDWFTLAVAVGSFAGLQWGRWNVIPVVLGSGLLGLFFSLLS
jgi:hypothetical protein